MSLTILRPPETESLLQHILREQTPSSRILPMEARRATKDSSNFKGTMPIESYLDKLDPYRSSTLTWPYPVKKTPASPHTAQQIEPHRSQIQEILNNHAFPKRAFLRFEINQVTKSQYPSIPIKTLLSLEFITDPFSDSAPKPPSRETLDLARDDIAHLLKKNHLEQFHVEIVFTCQAFDPVCFCIEDTCAEVKLFESSRRIIQNRILSKLRGDWRKMQIFNVGLTKEEATPTIVVLVEPFARGDWDGLTRQIQDVLKGEIEKGKDSSGDLELHVEFIPGILNKEIVYEEEEHDDDDEVVLNKNGKKDERKVEKKDEMDNNNAKGPFKNHDILLGKALAAQIKDFRLRKKEEEEEKDKDPFADFDAVMGDALKAQMRELGEFGTRGDENLNENLDKQEKMKYCMKQYPNKRAKRLMNLDRVKL